MPRPRVYRTQAIVLREQDYGEADRILTLLSPGGKFSVLARGIRRTTSRKAGHLGLFHLADIMLAQGRNLDIVTQADALDVYEGLWHDLLRFTYACYAAELVDRFVPEKEENAQLFVLLANALRWFAELDDLRLWARHFELILLRLLGYMPDFFECVVCKEAIQPEANRFDVAHGGLVCPSCVSTVASSKAVTLSAQKVLRYLATHDADAVAQLRLQEATHQEVEDLIHSFLQYTLERELKSTALLRRLRSELAMHESTHANSHADAATSLE